MKGARDLTWPNLPEGKGFKPTQWRFMTARSPFRFFIAGSGAGKTMTLCQALLWLLMKYPGNRLLIGRRTEKDYQATTGKTLWGIPGKPGVLPRWFVDWKLSDKENRTFVMINGSEFREVHYDDPSQFGSGELGGFLMDEISDNEDDSVWNMLTSRLRWVLPDGTRPPYLGLVAGYPNGHDWVWKKSHPDSPERLPGHEWFTPAPYENADNLPEGYYDNLIRANSVDWVNRFVHGRSDVFEGQIWKDWSPDLHLVNPFEVPEGWPKIAAIDPGLSAPTACVWAAVDEMSNLVFYRDYCERNASVAAHADYFISITAREAIQTWYADPAAWTDKGTRAPQLGGRGVERYNWADEYADAGIQLVKAENALQAGISRVTTWLKPDPSRAFPAWHKRAGQLGSPRIFVFRSCENIKNYIPEWRWKDPILHPNVPSSKDDHVCDSLRYLVMSRAEGRTQDHKPRALSWQLQRKIQQTYQANAPMRAHAAMAAYLKEQSDIDSEEGGEYY